MLRARRCPLQGLDATGLPLSVPTGPYRCTRGLVVVLIHPLIHIGTVRLLERTSDTVAIGCCTKQRAIGGGSSRRRDLDQTKDIKRSLVEAGTSIQWDFILSNYTIDFVAPPACLSAC